MTVVLRFEEAFLQFATTAIQKSLVGGKRENILDFFQSQHLAHKLTVANKYVAFAHITCDHPHGEPQFLICSGCHRVNEISLAKSAMNALKRSVEDAGFHLTNSKLEVSCLCDDCANAAA